MAEQAKKAMPQDADGETMPLVPAIAPFARTYDTSVSTSTEITLNAATSLLEVTALSQGVFMKWGTADVTSSNFDEFIPAGATRHYVVPPSLAPTAVNFLEQAASATLIVIEK